MELVSILIIAVGCYVGDHVLNERIKLSEKLSQWLLPDSEK